MAIYKDKKRGTWYFRIYIEDRTGQKKQKTRSGFRTKQIAIEEERKFISEQNKQFSDITFYELYETFIRDKSQKLKSSSIRAIKNRYEKHILPFFKDYKINKITHKDYIEWKELIIKKGYNYKYNKSLHTAMVSILNYAINFYNLEKNIASKVGNFSKGNYIRKVNFWTYEEFTKFINIVNEPLYKTLYLTLYNTGMRIGECLALNWNDLKGNKLSINKTIDKSQQITPPKTNSSIRVLEIDNTTLEYLLALKAHYESMIGFNNNWFIFGGLNPLSQTTINRKKNTYCKKANVKQIKIHDLRHSHATLLLSNLVPISVISKRLGHSNISMTLDVYSHLIPEDESKATSILNDLNNKNDILRENKENLFLSNKKTPTAKEIFN